MKTGPKPRNFIERFTESFTPEPNSGCWIWTKKLNNKGYGVLFVGNRTDGNRGWAIASRISWVIHNGQIPHGLFVCHKCDFPPCVNPEHLFIGSRADNAADMASKGRGRKPDYTRTHCRNGHELKHDGNPCNLCHTAAAKRFYERHSDEIKQKKRSKYITDKQITIRTR